MSEPQIDADITALMKKLEYGDGDAEDGQAEARVIVAVDWSRAAAPLAILKAFRALVPPTAPIRLVFAVPHEPSQADAACVEVLAEGVDGGFGIRGLEVESFDSVSTRPYDCAVVPDGDAEHTLMEMSGVIVRLADLMRHYEQARSTGRRPTAVTSNPGDPAALSERLAQFCA